MIVKYTEKTTPFSRWNTKYRCEEEPKKESEKMIKRNGKYITLQDYINENNQDCTIYQVLEAYRGDLKLTQERLNTISKDVMDELQGIDGLRDALEIMNKAKKAWVELPIEIRKEFGNNISTFQQNGYAWAKAKQDEINALANKVSDEGVKENG